MTHICVGKLAIIGSDNGLSPGRHQASIWNNAAILLIWTLGTNFSEGGWGGEGVGGGHRQGAPGGGPQACQTNDSPFQVCLATGGQKMLRHYENRYKYIHQILLMGPRMRKN